MCNAPAGIDPTSDAVIASFISIHVKEAAEPPGQAEVLLACPISACYNFTVQEIGCLLATPPISLNIK
jgi:hypothetical protein